MPPDRPPPAPFSPRARAQPTEPAFGGLLVLVQVVAPGDSQVVPGEGICGGELVICFDILFPKTLSMKQKKDIKALGM